MKLIFKKKECFDEAVLMTTLCIQTICMICL